MYVCLYVSHLMYVRMHVCIASDVCMDVCNIMYHIYTCTCMHVCMHVWMDDACMCILHLMLVCNYASYLVYIACVVGACLYASHLLYACVYKCMCCIWCMCTCMYACIWCIYMCMHRSDCIVFGVWCMCRNLYVSYLMYSKSRSPQIHSVRRVKMGIIWAG